MKLKYNQIVFILLLLLIPLFPIFFRLNFTTSQYGFLDIISMLPIYAWMYLFVWVSLLCIHILMIKKINFSHVILLGLFIQVMYPLSQYPTIIHGDTFYHGISTRQVMNAGNTQVDSLYPKLWPGTFIFWTVFSKVTGLDVITGNLIIIILFSLVISGILYFLGVKLINENWGGLAPMTYFIARPIDRYSLLLDHVSPFAFSIVQLFLVIFFLNRAYDKKDKFRREFIVLAVLSIFIIVISHSFASLFLLFILIGISFFQEPGIITRVKEMVFNPIIISTILLLLSWWIFTPGFTGSVLSFDRTADYLTTNFWKMFSTSKISQVGLPILQEPLPVLGMYLRNYFLKPVVGIAFILTIIGFITETNSYFIKGVFIGTFSATVIAYLIPFNMGRISQFVEFITILTFPASYLIVRFLIKYKRIVIILLCFFPLITVLSFSTMFTYSSEYQTTFKNWEISGCKFFIDTTYYWQPVITDSHTALLYKFYDYKHEPIYKFINTIELLDIDYDWFDNSTFLFKERYYGTIILRSFQQEVTYSINIKDFNERNKLWTKSDLKLSNETMLNRIYDNGFQQGYI